jgi:hypothetical protein
MRQKDIDTLTNLVRGLLNEHMKIINKSSVPIIACFPLEYKNAELAIRTQDVPGLIDAIRWLEDLE